MENNKLIYEYCKPIADIKIKEIKFNADEVIFF
jgi:hypothetical protein